MSALSSNFRHKQTSQDRHLWGHRVLCYLPYGLYRLVHCSHDTMYFSERPETSHLRQRSTGNRHLRRSQFLHRSLPRHLTDPVHHQAPSPPKAEGWGTLHLPFWQHVRTSSYVRTSHLHALTMLPRACAVSFARLIYTAVRLHDHDTLYYAALTTELTYVSSIPSHIEDQVLSSLKDRGAQRWPHHSLNVRDAAVLLEVEAFQGFDLQLAQEPALREPRPLQE